MNRERGQEELQEAALDQIQQRYNTFTKSQHIADQPLRVRTRTLLPLPEDPSWLLFIAFLRSRTLPPPLTYLAFERLGASEAAHKILQASLVMQRGRTAMC
jgi:hypothetical protein